MINSKDKESWNVAHFKPEEVRRLEINSRISRIHVTAGKGDEILAEWHNTTVRKTRASLKGDTLYISEDTIVAFYEVFGLIELGKNKDFYLYLPADYKGDVSICTSHEPVFLTGIHMMGKVKIRTGSGAIELHDIQARAWDIKSDCGSICAERLCAESKIRAETPVGKIDISLVPQIRGYDIHAKTDMGQCIIPQNMGRGEIPVDIVSSTGTINIELEEDD